VLRRALHSCGDTSISTPRKVSSTSSPINLMLHPVVNISEIPECVKLVDIRPLWVGWHIDLCEIYTILGLFLLFFFYLRHVCC
jgi:hypothetical protein